MLKNNLKSVCILLWMCLVILACQSVTISPTPSPTVLPSSTSSPVTYVPAVTPTLTSISLPFSGDFSVNQYGWPIGYTPGKYADTTYEIVSGIYSWTVLAHKNAYSIGWPDLPVVSSFTLTVDARQASEKLDDSDYGIIYRSMDGQNYFSFALKKNKYSVYYFDKTNGWKELIPWKPSSAIQPGKMNRLKLIYANGAFTFFANEKELTKLSDNSIIQGRLGLGVNVYTDGETAVFELDNFTVTSP